MSNQTDIFDVIESRLDKLSKSLEGLNTGLQIPAQKWLKEAFNSYAIKLSSKLPRTFVNSLKLRNPNLLQNIG